MKSYFNLSLILLLINWYSCTKVTVDQNGGYRELVIAIHKNVDEDQEIIVNLKELLINASSALHVATRGGVYFEEITIALPSSWSHQGYYDRTVKDHFQDADIKVAVSSFSTAPFTLQSGGCGEPGQYIQLSPEYLLNVKEPLFYKDFGFPDKRFVQEWAKFRYGVFDESVEIEDTNTKRYYKDTSGKTLPTLCSTELTSMGYNVDRKNFPCNPETQPGECHFELDDYYVTSGSSIMFSASFFSISQFCDNTIGNKHNHLAPNQHNRLCKYTSTWDVIKKHSDFQIRKIPASVPVRDTKPKFRFVRTLGGGGRVVLLLDISGSMAGVPMQLLHETARRHILENAPDNSEIGIVVFGTNAREVQPVQKVDSLTRNSIADRVPKEANGGGTAIGRGLNTAVDSLKKSGQLEGSVILLITDGEENEQPYIDSVLPDLVDARVVVSVIAYGEKASVKLEELALATGGKASIFREIHNKEAKTSVLGTMIIEATTVQADIEFEAVKLADNTPIPITSSILVETINLEPELGKNTLFKFDWGVPNAITVELKSPSGKIYNIQSPEFLQDATGKSAKFRFLQAETGIWTYTITRSIPNDVTTKRVDFSLLSEPTDPKKQPVRVVPWLDNTEVEAQSPPKVFARVHKDELPVLKVTVDAVIDGPNDYYATFAMRDDGLGADTISDNGVYSGYINRFKGNGRYSVRAQVHGGQKAVIKNPQKHRRFKKHRKQFKREVISLNEENLLKTNLTLNLADETDQLEEDYDYDEYDVTIDVIEDPNLNSLRRVQDIGVFRLSKWTEELGDIVPPCRVVDLEVLDTSWTLEDVVTVTMVWTTSDDDSGTDVELRISDNFDSLLHNFGNQFSLDDSHLVLINDVTNNVTNSNNNSLKSTAPFSKVNLTFQLPFEVLLTIPIIPTVNDLSLTLTNTSNNSTSGSDSLTPFPVQLPLDETLFLSKTLYFALRYNDTSGNVGEISNLVAANFVKDVLPPEVPITTEMTLDMADIGSNNGKSGTETRNTSSVVAISCVVVAVVVLAVVAAIFYFFRQYKHKYEGVLMISVTSS